VLKPGLYLGDQKKNRFEPAQPLANAMRPGEFCDRIELESGDPNVVKYLKGETIEVDHGGSGWQLVCVDGFPLGFGKLNRGMLKNKYNAAWRLF
jgi:NOL1/NOP2/fmu family ribosome biogenesis protein